MVKMSNGQSYIHFPDSNAIWHETYILSPPPQIWSLWYNGIGETYYNGDTVINNKMYHKLYQKIRNIFCSQIIEQTYYAGALREDTINKKVYSMDSWQNEEHLLYDFTLQPGDMLPYSSGAIVDFIDTIITNDGIKRSRWNVSGGYYSSAVIEGIGGTHGLLSNYLLMEYPDVTLCFEGDSKQTVYVNSYFGYGYGYCNVITDTCYYLSTSDMKLNEVQVYPNPADIYVNVDIPANFKIVSFELIDLSGNQIKKTNFQFSSNLIHFDISEYPSGVYIFVTRTLTNTYYNKLIINH
jgi:hypothetical protein